MHQGMPDGSSRHPVSSSTLAGQEARAVPSFQSSTLVDIDSLKSSSEETRELESKDDDILAQATEFTRHVQPPAYKPSALSKPVAIPQTTADTGQAFSRRWCPALTAYNVTESDFVELIDNLNVVATENPPLQVLDLVGGALGMVPSSVAQLAGAGVQVLSKLGTIMVSKSRTDIYMKAVNRNFFAPRGLKATIATREAMIILLGLPDSVGKLAPITDGDMKISVVRRRLEAMRPHIAELRLDFPPPVQQTTILAKMSAAQVERRAARAEKNVLKQRQKQVELMQKENEKLEKKESKKEKKYEKEMVKLEKDARKAEKEAEKDSKKGGRSGEKAEGKLREELAKIGESRKKLEGEFGHDLGNDATSSSKAAGKDKESKQAL